MAKGLAVILLPLYTRPRAAQGLRRLPVAADRGDPVEHLPAGGAGGGVCALLLHRPRHRAPRTDRAHGHGDGRVDDDGRGAGRAGLLGRALPADPGLPRPRPDGLRDSRHVGLHEPRNGLRPAARGRTRARLPVRLDGQRGDDGHVHGAAGRVRRPAGAGPTAGQLRRLGDRGVRPVGRARASAPILPAFPRPRPARDAALRRADRAGRRQRLRTAGRGPPLPLPRLLGKRGRPLLDRVAAGHRGVPAGEGLPVRMAAAGLLDQERRRGLAAVLPS